MRGGDLSTGTGQPTPPPFIPRRLAELEFDWPPELDHLSASSIKMAARCPEQWRQRYCLGKIQPPNLPMLAGRADHAAIEKSMRQKISSHVDLPLQEVKDTFSQVFEEEVEEQGGINEIEVRNGDPVKAMDEIRKTGPTAVGVYHQQVSPVIQPTHVEHEFRYPVPGLPVELLGYIDLMVHDVATGTGEPEFIIDRKRSGRASSKPQPEWTIQAEVYQLVYPIPHCWHITVPPSRVILPATDNELVQFVRPREISELLLNQIVAEIGTLYQRYGPESPWPAKGKLHPWACSYCGYRKDCWGWR